MKTLNNLFSKSVCVKNMADFSHFSLNVSQMNAIKGGTEPIKTDPGDAPGYPPNNDI